MKNKLQLFLITITLIGVSHFVFAESDIKNKKDKLSKSNSQPEYARFNINNITTWVKNNGEADLSVGGNSGFIYPKGSNKACIYNSGFLYGGKVNGQIRVGGSTYNQGQIPGRILENRSAEDPNLDHVRIYRVRRNYKTNSHSEEIADEGQTFEYVYNSYDKDWNEWPAEFGAPYEDINNNGIYEAEVDIPGEPGADQTIWFVANDLDPTAMKNFYGSPPIGIEMQVTVYGYQNKNLYKNTMFKKYKLINKSKNDFTEMFIGMWSDPDVGDASDDFYGCDSTLNLGYAYNGTPIDATYDDRAPAVGFQILQGPKNINSQILKMTSFFGIIKSDPLYHDPILSHYVYGTLEMYNYLQGKISTGEHLFKNPLGGYTKYMVSGDPYTKEGWIDGIVIPPADRRMMLSSGPFEMAVGDTQEIIIATSAYQGTDHLNSVYGLKQLSKSIQKIFPSLSNIIKRPEVKSKGINYSVILYWGEFKETINLIENHKIGEMEFQGYNIYQLPREDSPISDYKRIATFDKIDGIKEVVQEKIDENNGFYNLQVKQFGTDSGIERFIEIKRDFINNSTLKNGTPYYYVVSSYAVGDPNFTLFNNYETYSDVIKIIPQSPNPGVKYNSDIGDKIESLQIRGSGKADIDIIVVDPTEVNCSEYEISFERNSENKLEWSLYNIDSNKTVLTNQKNISGLDDYLIVEGIRIKIKEDTNQPLTKEDEFKFSTPSVTYNIEQARIDIEDIKTFPNPYYGFNSLETSKFYNYIMINHLPQKATIRVFNLAGQLVRTLKKDSPDQYYIWDLQNEKRIPVASGLFIIHIDMPELGKTKILKQAVILNQVIPDFY